LTAADGAPILCLNGGSSSLKMAVFDFAANSERRLLSGFVEGIGTGEGRFSLRDGDRVVADQKQNVTDHRSASRVAFAALQQQGLKAFAGCGHRIVHGGPTLHEPSRIDEKLKATLKQLIPFAPLHLPSEIALIESVSEHFPDLPQVACFDTAFHFRLPEVARNFALPRKLREQGIRRYGFHGLSYEYVVSELGSEIGERAIIAHLGNGASMVALKNGSPVDTSMGLTPAGGFMMGTRTGDLDPGVLLYLLRQGWSSDALGRLIDRESGLLGVSGNSSDMKTLLDERATSSHAAEAVEMFCYQVRKFVGAYAAVLGGLDTLVFTGGIGERAAQIRAEICQGLSYLGIELDSGQNARHSEVISTESSHCKVRVVKTDEDLMIARHTRRVVMR